MVGSSKQVVLMSSEKLDWNKTFNLVSMQFFFVSFLLL